MGRRGPSLSSPGSDVGIADRGATRRERRRGAALAAAETREAKARARPPPAEPFAGPQPTRMDLMRRAQAFD
jgi:hypothetical protein